MAATKTAGELLDTAQRFVQHRGFNAFSYKDLASEVGIRTASIHYHFPAKADLGKALMARYRVALDTTLAKLDASNRSPKAKLKQFIGFYRATQGMGAICVCGSLAADLETLPEGVRDEVTDYIKGSESWIAKTIKAGVDAGDFEPDLSPTAVAASLLAGLQGALILSRARDGAPEVLNSVEKSFFLTLAAS